MELKKEEQSVKLQFKIDKEVHPVMPLSEQDLKKIREATRLLNRSNWSPNPIYWPERAKSNITEDIEYEDVTHKRLVE